MRVPVLVLGALAVVLVGAVAVGFLVLPGGGGGPTAAAPTCDPRSSTPYGLVLIGAHPRVDLMLARTPDERETGLMYVEKLPPDSGMLFVYQAEAREAYWMYHTLIPLSIAFIARDGTIVDVKDMARLNNPDDVQEAGRTVYPSKAPYWYALEVNQGWFVQHGVAVGQQFMLCLGS